MRSLFLWLGIVGGAIPTLAQAPASAANGAGAGTVHDVVLVTAALVDEPGSRLPVSADVIEREEIVARQATAVADLLRSVAGLDVVRSGSAGKVTSLFTRGTESDHTLVLWNGIELNDPFFGGFDWGLMPTEGVDRIEVVRGPFSALYGSDALGGVVQIFTGGGGEDTVGLEVGKDGYRRATLAASVESGGGRYDVAAHSRRGDGLAENDFYDSDELVAQGRWRAGERLELGLVVRANESQLGIPYSGGVATPQRTSNWQETEVALPVTLELGDWRLEGRVSRVSLDSELLDPDDPFGYTSSGSSSVSQRARLVASHRFNEDLWLALGSEYERQEVDSGSVFGPDLEGAGQTTRALFSQLFYAAGRWQFDLGLRQDDHDAFGSAATPRFGIGRRTGAHGRLRAAYGKGFRSPSIGELFFPFSGNPELEPEESVSLEVGYEFDNETWAFSLTGFESRLTNLIDFDFAQFKNVNIGRARTRGAELGLERGWGAARLRANATYLEATDEGSSLPLLRRPEWRGSLVGTWRAGAWGWTATALYTGARDDVDPLTFGRSRNPAYGRLDVGVAFRGWQRLTPYTRVENVADRKYFEALGFAAPGRQLIGGLSLAF
jgi:vitamin B12 transporter